MEFWKVKQTVEHVVSKQLTKFSKFKLPILYPSDIVGKGSDIVGVVVHGD